MNGVAETLLEELLAQTKTNTQLLQKMAKSFSGSGGAGGGAAGGVGAAAAAAGLVSSFNPLSLGIKAITGSFNLLKSIVGGIVNIFSTLASATIGVVKNLVDFGKRAMEAGVRLSDFLNVFGGLPIVGNLFKIGASISQIAEGILESYRNISGVGATFGGDIMAVTKAAAQAGLTIGEFTRIVRQNSEIFSFFGGTVQNGVNLFSSSVRKMLAPDSVTGISILGLGVRFDEAAEYLAGYMMNLTQTGDTQRMSSEEIAAAGREYIVQLDGLARLTGQERKQLDEKMKAARLDQNFQAYLASLEPEQRKVVARMVETASAISPDLGKEVRARFLGVTAPVTEMGKSLAASGSSFMYDINLFRKAMNSGMSEAQAHAYMLELTAKLGMNQAQLIEKAPYILESGFITLDAAVTGLGNRANRAGGSLQKAFEDIEKEQRQASSGSAEAAARTELAMRDLGNAFNQAFLDAAGNLIPVVQSLGMQMGNLVSKFIVPLAKAVAPLVDQFLKWIDSLAEMRKAGASWTDVFKQAFEDIGKQMSKLWDVIKGPIKEAFGKIQDFLTPFFQKLLIHMEYYIDRWIDEKIGGINQKDEAERLTKRNYELALISQKQADQEELSAANSELIKAAVARKELLLKHHGYTVKGERIPSGTVRDEVLAIDKVLASIPNMAANRHSGTIGMTGNWWEKEDTTVNIQAGETVLTQSQLSQIMDTAGQNNLAIEVRKLNTLSAQMLEYLKQTADNTRQSTRATRALNGNAFEAV
jgi:hypothetical protein